MPTRMLVAIIWICFLIRGWFCASMFPLWEGYDEFAHFGVARAVALHGILLPDRDQRCSRDIGESLRLAPIPWAIQTWPVFHFSLTEDSYWKLSAEERSDRERKLRAIDPALAREDAIDNINAYEAYQPPLTYWLAAPVLLLLKSAGLLAQVMILRWIGVCLASFAIPLAFAVGLEATQSELAAFGCAAVIAVMPEFATNLARFSNEPLSILLFSLLIWIGCRIVTRGLTTRRTVALGVVFGLGLLTKAYFLTAIPAVALLLLYKRRGTSRQVIQAAAIPAVIAGWYYIRNLILTGTVSGLAEPVILHQQGRSTTLADVVHAPWLRGVDVILTSHLYYSGWSGLTLRSWMYHVLYAIAILAALGLIRHLRQPVVWWLVAIYGFFWLGQLYNVLLQFLARNLVGSMGWYMYAVVICEAVLCAVAFGRYRSWMLIAGAFLFAVLDLYGMHWAAIPYYTGLIGHRANGMLEALHIGQYRAIGWHALFERMAVNKWAPISADFLMVLWMLYLAATITPAVLVVCASRAIHSSAGGGASPS